MFSALTDFILFFSDSLNNKTLKIISNPDWHISMKISENLEKLLCLSLEIFHSSFASPAFFYPLQNIKNKHRPIKNKKQKEEIWNYY